MKVPQHVVDIFSQIPEDIYAGGVIVFAECQYQGMVFRIQTSRSGNGVYIKKLKGQPGWKYHDGSLKDTIKDITAKQDKKLSKEASDHEKNEELANSFARFLCHLGGVKRIEMHIDGKVYTWMIGNTLVEMHCNANRFVLNGKGKKTSAIKPAIAIDRLLNFEPSAVMNKMTEAEAELRGEEAYKRMKKCIKRRDERKEDAEKIETIFDKIGKPCKLDPKKTRYLKKWRVDYLVITYDFFAHKFNADGEWMLPFQALDKIAKLVPSVAKKVADPDII